MSERAENLIIHLLQEILQQFEGHSDGASVDFFWSLIQQPVRLGLRLRLHWPQRDPCPSRNRDLSSRA